METTKNYSPQIRSELLRIIAHKKRFCMFAMIMSFLMLFLPMFNVNSTLWGTSSPRGIFGVILKGVTQNFFNSFEDNKSFLFLGLASTIMMIVVLVRTLMVIRRSVFWMSRLNRYLNNTCELRDFEYDLNLMYLPKNIQTQRKFGRPTTKPLPQAGLWMNFFLIVLANIMSDMFFWLAKNTEGMYLVNPVSPNRLFLIMCVFLFALLVYGGITAHMEKRVRVRIALEDEIREAKRNLRATEDPSFDNTDAYKANEVVKRSFNKDVGKLIKKKKVLSIVGACIFLGSLFLPLFVAPSAEPAAPMIIRLFDKLVLTDSGDGISFLGHILGFGSSFDWYYYACLLGCIPLIMKGIGCILKFVAFKKNSDEENMIWFYDDYAEGTNHKKYNSQYLDLTDPMNFSNVAESLTMMLFGCSICFAVTLGAPYQSALTFAVGNFASGELFSIIVLGLGMLPLFLWIPIFYITPHLMFSGVVSSGKYLKMSGTFYNHCRLLKQQRREEEEKQEETRRKELEEKNRLAMQEAEEKRKEEQKAEQEAMIAEAVARAKEEQDQKNEENIVNTLKQYKELLDTGIITQEEFDEKKRQLLEK